jgi:hypothetical protein
VAKTYTPEALAQRVFILVMLGISGEIAAMVYLGFFA